MCIGRYSGDIGQEAGVTSLRPRRKSSRPTLRPARSIFLRLSPPPVVRARAYEDAALTSPSISAPEKFLVLAASSGRSTPASR